MWSKIVFSFVLAITIFSLSGVSVFAATLLQVTNTGDGPGIGNTNGGQAGTQSFIAGDWSVSTVELPMKADSQGANDITLTIRTDDGTGSGGCPTGTVVTNATATISPFGTTSYTTKSFNFSSNVTLTSGTKYWLYEYSPTGIYRVQGRDSDTYSSGQWGYFNGGLPPPTCQKPNDGTDTGFTIIGTDLSAPTSTPSSGGDYIVIPSSSSGFISWLLVIFIVCVVIFIFRMKSYE